MGWPTSGTAGAVLGIGPAGLKASPTGFPLAAQPVVDPGLVPPPFPAHVRVLAGRRIPRPRVCVVEPVMKRLVEDLPAVVALFGEVGCPSR